MHLSRRGNSMVSWAVLFSMVIAALGILNSTIKRGIQGKARQSANYFLWTAWEKEAEEPYNKKPPYEGEKTTHSRGEVVSNQTATIEQKSSPEITTTIASTTNEKGASASSEEGSEALLKLFPLN